MTATSVGPLEGVIKFVADHTVGPLDPGRYGALAGRLLAWRTLLFDAGLVGQDPARYDGAGYGNLSCRVGVRAFLVSGTQTGGVRDLGRDGLCVVEDWDLARNHVVSHGPARPSSESMTHGAIYELSPSIAWVFHGHSPHVWRRRELLGIPTTDAAVAYGTPEMARAVATLYAGSALPDARILAMGGHEDGIVTFGVTAEEAGEVLLKHLAWAYEAERSGR